MKFPFFEVRAYRNNEEVKSESFRTLSEAKDAIVLFKNEHDTLISQNRRGYELIHLVQVKSEAIDVCCETLQFEA